MRVGVISSLRLFSRVELMSSWPVECLGLRFFMISSISVSGIVENENVGALCGRK